jgi:hypothetical protein
MRSTSLKMSLVIGLLIFAVAFGACMAINSYSDNISNAFYPDSDEVANALYPDSKPPKNDLIDMYEVKFEPTSACEDFRSSAGAYRAFQKHYKSAGLWCHNSKLLRREPKFDATGQRTGMRVTAIIGCGEEGQQYAVIWWTDGPRFCHIEAPQMYQAEDLERTNAR